MKKFFKATVACLAFVLASAGCGQKADNESDVSKVLTAAENSVAERVVNYAFYNDYSTPGTALEYSRLWNGEGAYETFVTDYAATDENVLCVYMKAAEIPALKTALGSCEDVRSVDYPFTDSENEDVIDGKYLYAYNLAKNDFTAPECYSVKAGDEIPFKTGDMQLVFCCASKSATIKSNVSKAEEINKEIKVYFRKIYARSENSVSESNEVTAESIAFAYTGEALEVFYPTYAGRDYVYCPIFGLDENVRTVRAALVDYNGEKCVRLPRYTLSADGKVDLLDENANLVGLDDVYKSQKAAFKAAEKTKADSDNVYEYYLFDYASVANIIKTVKD